MSRESTSLTIKPLGPLATAITQLYRPPQTEIRGVETTGWFGPLQPVKPIAPPGTEPRGFQYPPGQNLIFTPRSNEALTFADLRTAANYDMVRVIIENVKDQVCRMPINVRLRRLPGETAKEYAARQPDKKIVQDLTDLIDHPNSDDDRGSFMRKLMEDMLVIDAPAVLFRTTKSNKLIELRAIDGATLTRYIDEQGYTPQAPSPAYAQLWYGIPMVELSTDQLLYAARNIPTYRLYGISPVEQAITWIRIGAERLKFQMSYYTEGTIPDAIQVVAPGVPVDKISEAQTWMVSDLAGMLGKRRQLRMIQGFSPDGKDQILFPKEALLTDQTDDFLIRCLCFAFGTSPQRLMRMMNRATAEQADTSADKEGLEPWLDWATNGVWNKIIQQKLGFADYEATFEEDRTVDPKEQAEIDASDVNTGIRTRNQVREDRGLEPSQLPEADMLTITTAAGIVPLSAEEDIKRAKAKAEAMPAPAPSPFGGGGGNPSPGGPSDDAEKKTLKSARMAALLKAGRITINPTALTPESLAARTRLHSALKVLFAKQKKIAIAEARKLVKAEESFKDVADKIYAAILKEYPTLVSEAAEALASSGTSGVATGANQLATHDTAMIAEANQVARKYAEDRAAELVGMRRLEDGSLVENPNAEWAISTTTRDEIRTAVKNAFESETKLSDLITRIQDSGSFSDSRATMIAKTEIQSAQSQGNYEVWKATGVVTKLKWLLSADHTIECVCNDNEDVEVDFGQPFPSGDFAPPAHPRCECVVAAVGFAE